jgi:hypothetical protein
MTNLKSKLGVMLQKDKDTKQEMDTPGDEEMSVG